MGAVETSHGGNTSRLAAMVSHKPPCLCTPTPLLEKVFQTSSFFAPLIPIVENPAFSPGLLDLIFQTMKSNSLFQAGHFIAVRHWVPRQRIWQKLQLADAWLHLNFCVWTVSQTYRMLVSPPPTYRLPYISKWEHDLGLSLTDKEVEKILLFTYKTSISSRHQE